MPACQHFLKSLPFTIALFILKSKGCRYFWYQTSSFRHVLKMNCMVFIKVCCVLVDILVYIAPKLNMIYAKKARRGQTVVSKCQNSLCGSMVASLLFYRKFLKNIMAIFWTERKWSMCCQQNDMWCADDDLLPGWRLKLESLESKGNQSDDWIAQERICTYYWRWIWKDSLRPWKGTCVPWNDTGISSLSSGKDHDV